MSGAPGAALLVSLALVGAACSSGSEPVPAGSTATAGGIASPAGPVTARALAEQVCGAVSHEYLLRIWRGTRLDLSGDVQILPREPNYVRGFSHAGPWDYVQDVPMLWYGPGYVRPGTYPQVTSAADIAPTEAALLQFAGFRAPDGRALTQALLPAADRSPPRLLVALVWDAGGWDVLNQWPHAWPYLRSLIPRGALFTHEAVGASPSNTPTIHATFGTGAFPNRNGIVDEFVRRNGLVQSPYSIGPSALLLPTLADLYDRAMGNAPLVGTIASLDAHLGMMGHGSQWAGGDRDIAVIRQDEAAGTGGAVGTEWNITKAMAPFYRFPAYVNGVSGLARDAHALDAADGAIDGNWRDDAIAPLAGGFNTPAADPYETRVIEDVIRREGFGADGVPDLLFVNYKTIDTVGHLYSLNSPEMADSVRAQDEQLNVLVDFLNRQVGAGNWAMVLTADHGHQYDPAVSGAFQIGIDPLQALIERAFDSDGDATPVVEQMRPTEIWLNEAELAKNGHTDADVARFIQALPESELATPGEGVPARDRAAKPFATAFPSSILTRLPCLPEARAS